jgi:hypothetical protein
MHDPATKTLRAAKFLFTGPLVLAFLFMVNLQVQGAALRHSDVVFMYQADPGVYARYGATVLAWGAKPTARSLEQNKGLRVFGSVGMVTEFARYYERFPDTYQQALCRDINGQPVKVPWLTDHQYKGIPYWWCCTQQPRFRQYLRERVIETVKAGADGVHIDDHLGTAGGLWLGLCFCDRCVDGFRSYLKALPETERRRLGLERPDTFNYRDVVRRWLAEDKSRKVTQHPLWDQWTIYQCRAAAAFMRELRETAAQTAGHPVPIGANAGLLWPRHLADYQSLDLFSAETDHHAQQERFSDLPLFAYRMADAVERPYAATASGGDWAYIKEYNLPGLVRGWIALAYAAGQYLMAPHRQWCYTPEKGTHWYQGPDEKFAPLYQFVRQNAALFDDYETYADMAVLMPHRSFLKNPNRWFQLANQLAAKNVSYRLLLAGDEIVDHPLSAEALNSSPVLLAPDLEDLMPRDRQLLDQLAKRQPPFRTLTEALAAIQPAAQVEGERPVRVLPRVKPGAAVIHLLNYQYDRARDDIDRLHNVRLKLNLKALGVVSASSCSFLQPGAPARSLPIANGAVDVPDLGLWAILNPKPEFRDPK